jgi:tetratricopeptide (TPR) repeat protein
MIAHLALFLSLFGAQGVPVHARDSSRDAARLVAARAAFDASRWGEAAKLAQGPAQQSPELDFLAGLAFAHLEQWNEARNALEAGHRKSPGDARFLVELAGVAYKQKDLRTAKHDLEAALRLDPHDAYTHEFFGTLYLLEGNLEAALKYWNAVDKPRLRAVDIVPPPKLRQELLAQAVTFTAPQVLTSDALAPASRAGCIEVRKLRCHAALG